MASRLSQANPKAACQSVMNTNSMQGSAEAELVSKLGAHSIFGTKGRSMRRQGARCTQHLCCARLCVCLHHLLVTCSGQPVNTCDPSGARGQSSHRPGGEAMAAGAVSPGTSLQPVLRGTCDTPSHTLPCACRCVLYGHGILDFCFVPAVVRC